MTRGLIAALFSAALLHAQSMPNAPPNPNSVFSVSTTLVQVDAEVTGPRHRHVTDLQAGDFEVILDHKIQPITNFTYIHLDGSNGIASQPNSTRQTIRPEEVRRSMIIVIDDLGLSFESMYYVRRALRRFIDQEIGPGDLVAIWQTGRSNSLFQQLTSDKKILDAAVDSLRWNPRGQGLLHAFDSFHDGGGPFHNSQIPGAPPTSNRPSEPHTAGEADERAYLSTSLASGTLDTLAELVEELQTIGGRKAVVLFSDGMDTELPGVNGSSGGSPFYRALLEQMRNLIDRANRSGTVFYTIDVRGLQYAQPGEALKMAALQEPLLTLAEQTGGFAAINTNDLTGAMESIREDQQGYYLIGFKPPDNLSTKSGTNKLDFRSLHVRVKPPGLQVRSRAGFWGETDEAARRQRTPEEQMRLAAFSLFNRADIHVRLTPFYTRTSAGQPAVRNLLYIDARDFEFKKSPAGNREADLDVLVMASDSMLETTVPLSRRMHIAGIDDQLEKLRREGILLTMNVPLRRSGPYQVRVSVRDRDSGKIGSASQFLQIPDLRRVHLALTTPIVENASAAGEPADPSVVLREFYPGSTLSFVSILETDRDEKTKLPARDFEAQLQLYSEDKPILTTSVPVGDVAGQNVHVVKAEVRLNNSLPPGQYYLRATATGHNGKKTLRFATIWTDFQVLPQP